MPKETPEPDPLAMLAEAMQTTIGYQEAQLRQALGNDGYEAWKRSQSLATELGLAQAAATVDQLKAHAGMESARQQLYAALSIALLASVLLAIALVVWVIA